MAGCSENSNPGWDSSSGNSAMHAAVDFLSMLVQFYNRWQENKNLYSTVPIDISYFFIVTDEWNLQLPALQISAFWNTKRKNFKLCILLKSSWIFCKDNPYLILAAKEFYLVDKVCDK